MEIKLIQHNTADYEKMIALRIQVLLAPIGVPSSFINRTKEASDLLVGAFHGEDIIGCCVLTRLTSERVQLRQMAVDTETQGTGVGAAIIDFAERVAHNQGYRELLLNARDPVIPFYEKCGYRVHGEGFTEVGIAHHTMTKDL